MERFMEFEKLGLGKIRVLKERGVHGYFQFLFADVCDALGKDRGNAMRAIREDGLEDYIDEITVTRKQRNQYKDGFTQDFNMLLLEEPALYRLIFSSNKPEALEFQLWIFTVVIPSLRNYGAYLDRKKREEIQNDPEKIDEILAKLRDLDVKIEAGKKKLNRLQQECEKFDKSSDEYKARMWELFDKLVEMGEDPSQLFDEM